MSAIVELTTPRVVRPEQVAVQPHGFSFEVVRDTTPTTGVYQIPAALQCVLREPARTVHESCRGHIFAWMMSHDLEAGRKDTAVFYGTNPLIATAMYYDGRINNKDTRMAKGHWKVEVAMGPFAQEKAANEFCHTWVTGTRGKKSKITTAMRLATSRRIPFYWTAIPPPGGRLSYLAQHSPEPIASAVQKYCQENADLVKVKT